MTRSAAKAIAASLASASFAAICLSVSVSRSDVFSDIERNWQATARSCYAIGLAVGEARAQGRDTEPEVQKVISQAEAACFARAAL
jgi:hypothetical protein